VTQTRPENGQPGALAQALSARTRSEPRAYDFRRPTKLSRDHVRVLQIAQESFARQGTTVLTTSLRTGARIDYDVIEQVGYDDYVATLDNPAFIATFDLNPLQGKGMLAMPLEVAMAFIDHMLGGSGTLAQPERGMTSMEGQVMRSLLNRLLDEFKSAFAPLVHLDPELDVIEHNPALAQTSAGSETVMVARFLLRVGLRESELSLCLPFNAFSETLKRATSPSLSERDKRQREAATRAVTERLRVVPVDVAVRHSPTEMFSIDLANLAVGDVITLGPKDSPLEVVTDDVVFAHAVPATHRRRRVAQIVPTPPTKKDH
jgi:flagellar motor switch protein FliM